MGDYDLSESYYYLYTRFLLSSFVLLALQSTATAEYGSILPDVLSQDRASFEWHDDNAGSVPLQLYARTA